MRYLVTGGCGFIGSHLARRLIAAGHEVTILDNLSSSSKENAPEEATVIVGDITDGAIVRDLVSDSDGCFHLAAIASVERCTNEMVASHETNVTGTIEIFAAVKDSGKRIPVVFASSAAVYGDNPNLPLGEAAQPHPLSSYGLDKLSCEYYGRIAFEAHRVPNVGLRLFNVYGPGQDPNSPYSGVISKFMKLAAEHQTLPVFGDGEQTRDFIFVDDVVSLFMAAMAMPNMEHHVFNGCTGKAVSINQMVELLSEILGEDIATETREPRAGDIRHSLGNPASAKQALGFVAATPFSDGLAQTLYYYGITGNA